MNYLNSFLRRALLVVCVVTIPGLARAQDNADDAQLKHSVEELRTSIGRWEATTDFLKDDGTVARTVSAIYEFSWVVPDRVAIGKNRIEELGQASGILFYVNEAERKIEMAAVGVDGKLWVMTGPLGGEVRVSQEYAMPDGGTGQLRFTRFNVAQDSFESRMEVTSDGGATWKPGNRQRFKRME